MKFRNLSVFSWVLLCALIVPADPAQSADDCPEPDISWIKKYPKWIQDRALETKNRMDPEVYRKAMCSLRNVGRNPDVDSQPGPQVWVEENWLVKQADWPKFREAYKREIYSLARKTPGYRGYTFLTTIVPGPDEPEEQHNGGGWGDDPRAISRFILGDGLRGPLFIKPHGKIQLHGIEHGLSIAWDTLFLRTFNVQIIHHIQTWEDADRFYQRMADIFAAQNRGETLADRLAKTVFPYAENYWTSTFRMIRTSWDWERPVARGNDADGLDLEPRPNPVVLVAEHWDVKPDRFCQFLEDMEKHVERYDRHDIGERGISYATSLPPQMCEPQAEPLTAEALRRLGGDDELYVPSPGVMIGGTVRTNYSINVGALYKKTFNVLLYRRFHSFAAQGLQSQFEEGSRSLYARDNGMKEDDTFSTLR